MSESKALKILGLITIVSTLCLQSESIGEFSIPPQMIKYSMTSGYPFQAEVPRVFSGYEHWQMSALSQRGFQNEQLYFCSLHESGKAEAQINLLYSFKPKMNSGEISGMGLTSLTKNKAFYTSLSAILNSSNENFRATIVQSEILTGISSKNSSSPAQDTPSTHTETQNSESIIAVLVEADTKQFIQFIKLDAQTQQFSSLGQFLISTLLTSPCRQLIKIGSSEVTGVICYSLTQVIFTSLNLEKNQISSNVITQLDSSAGQIVDVAITKVQGSQDGSVKLKIFTSENHLFDYEFQISSQTMTLIANNSIQTVPTFNKLNDIHVYSYGEQEAATGSMPVENSYMMAVSENIGLILVNIELNQNSAVPTQVQLQSILLFEVVKCTNIFHLNAYSYFFSVCDGNQLISISQALIRNCLTQSQNEASDSNSNTKTTIEKCLQQGQLGQSINQVTLLDHSAHSIHYDAYRSLIITTGHNRYTEFMFQLNLNRTEIIRLRRGSTFDSQLTLLRDVISLQMNKVVLFSERSLSIGTQHYPSYKVKCRTNQKSYFRDIEGRFYSNLTIQGSCDHNTINYKQALVSDSSNICSVVIPFRIEVTKFEETYDAIWVVLLSVGIVVLLFNVIYCGKQKLDLCRKHSRIHSEEFVEEQKTVEQKTEQSEL